MNNNNSLTALVTGATGFLGQHLCQQLTQQGWHVYGLCRSDEKAKALDSTINIVKGDILGPENFLNKLPPQLDAIFHTAASTNTWFKNNEIQTITNLQGTQNMLKLAIQKNVKKYVHISSVVVFGMHNKLKNITEDMPKNGADSFINYVKTKTASEKIVLQNKDINAIIINPAHIIGPGDRDNWARLIKMIANKKLPSIPNGSGSFVDVRDVAAGIILAFHKGVSGENYLLGGTDMSFKQFIHKVANILKVKPTSIQLPTFLLKVLAFIKNSISRITNKEPDITPESVALISDLYACDSKKAKTQLQFKNRPFEETLTDTITYMRHNHLI